MLIGSQFKEFFPLQMADAGRGKCTHAHAHCNPIHTQLIQGGFLTSRKHQARFRFVRLVEKIATVSKLKCFRDVRDKPVFLPKMPTKTAAVKMQKGLPACHCCQEKFLTSPKSRLHGNTNIFTYLQIVSCPILTWRIHWSFYLLYWGFRFLFSNSICV